MDVEAETVVGPASGTWFRRAEEVMAGGVSSPARSFKAVGGDPPVVMERGDGAYVVDVDGRTYIDYQAAFGPLVLGHAHPAVVEAVRRQVSRGSLVGATHPVEVRLAEELTRAIPGLEQLRFVTTGTEAVMSAIRLARAATGRATVVKFDGSYHGHSDAMLLEAGSGASTVGAKDSAGIPDGVRRDLVTLPYNDTAQVSAFMASHGHETACVLVEPVVGNMGLVEPAPDFLETLRDLTTKTGALLIFDEVITAFRFGYGAVGPVLGVIPDLYCLGKIIGGGLPGAAYGGARALMAELAPKGGAYQAGTLAGNPLSSAAGLATLDVLRRENPYPAMEALGRRLAEGLLEQAAAFGVAATVNRRGGMFTLFFGDEPVVDYRSALNTDAERFRRFYQALLRAGIFLAPSRLECWFVSAVHADREIVRTLEAAETAWRAL